MMNCQTNANIFKIIVFCLFIALSSVYGIQKVEAIRMEVPPTCIATFFRISVNGFLIFGPFYSGWENESPGCDRGGGIFNAGCDDTIKVELVSGPGKSTGANYVTIKNMDTGQSKVLCEWCDPDYHLHHPDAYLYGLSYPGDCTNDVYPSCSSPNSANTISEATPRALGLCNYGCVDQKCVQGPPEGSPPCSGSGDDTKCKYGCVGQTCKQGQGGSPSCDGVGQDAKCIYGCVGKTCTQGLGGSPCPGDEDNSASCIFRCVGQKCTQGLEGSPLCTGASDTTSCAYGCVAGRCEQGQGGSPSCNSASDTTSCILGCDPESQKCVYGNPGGMPCWEPGDTFECTYGCVDQKCVQGQAGSPSCNIAKGNADCEYGCNSTQQCILKGLNGKCDILKGNADCEYGCKLSVFGDSGVCILKKNGGTGDSCNPSDSNACKYGCTGYGKTATCKQGVAGTVGSCNPNNQNPCQYGCKGTGQTAQCVWVGEGGTDGSCAGPSDSAGCKFGCDMTHLTCIRGGNSQYPCLNSYDGASCLPGCNDKNQCVLGGFTGSNSCNLTNGNNDCEFHCAFQPCNLQNPVPGAMQQCGSQNICMKGGNGPLCNSAKDCQYECNYQPSIICDPTPTFPSNMYWNWCLGGDGPNAQCVIGGGGYACNGDWGCTPIPPCVGSACPCTDSSCACADTTCTCTNPVCLHHGECQQDGSCKQVDGAGSAACPNNCVATCRGSTCMPNGTGPVGGIICKGNGDCQYGCNNSNQCVLLSAGGSTPPCSGPDDDAKCQYFCEIENQQCVLNGDSGIKCAGPDAETSCQYFCDTQTQQCLLNGDSGIECSGLGDTTSCNYGCSGQSCVLGGTEGFCTGPDDSADCTPPPPQCGSASSDYPVAPVSFYFRETPSVWIPNFGDGTVTKFDSSTGNQYPGSPYDVGYGPAGVAVDSMGNIWISNFYDGTVTELDSSGSQIGSAITVGETPTGIAVDPSGNVWVANNGNSVTEINSSTRNPIRTYAVGNYPQGVAVDSYGNVWVANQYENSITKINPAKLPSDTTATHTYGPFGTLMDSPFGIAVDADNNIWVANSNSNTVVKFNGSTGAIIRPITVGNHPYGITVDSSNHVWVANGADNTVTELDATTGNQIGLPHSSGGTSPFGISADSFGNIWVSNEGSNTVTKLDSAGNQIGSPHEVGSQPYSFGDFTGYTSQHFTPDFCLVGTAMYNGISVPPAVIPFPTPNTQAHWTCAIGGTTEDCYANVDPQCGTANYQTYTDSNPPFYTANTTDDPSTQDSFCVPDAFGSSIPTYPPVPDDNGVISWQCNGYPGTNQADCVAWYIGQEVEPPLCGPAAKAYEACDTQFEGALCDSWTQDPGFPDPPDPKFPDPGGQTEWKCIALNGTDPVTCVATVPPCIAPADCIVGQCGPAAKMYTISEPFPDGDLCDHLGGTATTPSPFPLTTAGPTYWQCIGSNNGGLANPTCSACIAPNPVNGVCGPVTGIYSASDTNFSSKLKPTPYIWINNFLDNKVTKLDSSTGDQIGSSISLGTSDYGCNRSWQCVPGGTQGSCDIAYGNKDCELRDAGITGNGIAVDNLGNAWAVNSFGNSIAKINGSTGQKTTYSAGLGLKYPYGVAIDYSGNIWITNVGDARTENYTSGTVIKINSSGNLLKTYTGLNGPTEIAIDGFGNAWVSCAGDKTILRVGPTGCIEKYSVPIGQKPDGIAVDATGNVWVANYGDTITNGNSITKISPTGIEYPGNPYSSRSYSSGLGLKHPTGIAVDGSGNIWISNGYGNNAIKINQAGSKIGQSTEGFFNPFGIAIDATGNVWTANAGNSTVTKFNSSGSLIETYNIGSSREMYSTDSEGNFTGFNPGYCASGSVASSYPVFPSSGNTTTWTCKGANKGTDSPLCRAIRQ